MKNLTISLLLSLISIASFMFATQHLQGKRTFPIQGGTGMAFSDREYANMNDEEDLTAESFMPTMQHQQRKRTFPIQGGTGMAFSDREYENMNDDEVLIDQNQAPIKY